MNQMMLVIHSLQSVEPAVLEESITVALQSVGYEVLKPEKHYTIVELLRGRDTFVGLSTGYGKSLTYQVLPICATVILSWIPMLVCSLGGNLVTEQAQQVSIPRTDSCLLGILVCPRH